MLYCYGISIGGDWDCQSEPWEAGSRCRFCHLDYLCSLVTPGCGGRKSGIMGLCLEECGTMAQTLNILQELIVDIVNQVDCAQVSFRILVGVAMGFCLEGI